MKISSIAVLGAGSAGLIAALTLKIKLPHLNIRVVRSPGIGVIGVGEGTTAVLPNHFFEYLKVKPREFYLEAKPTWKMGIRFLWGNHKEFFYTFSHEFEQRQPEMARNNGFYYSPEQPWFGRASAYMYQDKVFPRRPDGMPQFHKNHAFHIENKTFVGWLENRCKEHGVVVTDATVTVEKGGLGIAALVTESGERITADFFIDASGFRSELLGKALEEPFISYADSLFCDRAVVAPWPRTTEKILPYTVAETMEAGWCWQIDHEDVINRGYVYSSRFLTEEQAEEEFVRKNPNAAGKTWKVKFRSGRYVRSWVGNVLAVGNAAGFVEPLEATALQVICVETSSFADSLLDSLCEPTPTLLKLYNRYNGQQWDDIRNFLSIHYRFNTKIDNKFWRTCREEVALHGAADIVEWFKENGPSALAKFALLHHSNSFGIDGYMALLVGQGVPYEKMYYPPPLEQEFWRKRRQELAAEATSQGMDSEEAIAALRKPGVKWA